jgi:hypothetical protein
MLSPRTLKRLPLLAVMALGACDAARSPAGPEQTDEIARIVGEMGFRSDMIQDFGDYVLVEGDIMFTKRELQDPGASSRDPFAPRYQYHSTNIVSSPGKIRDIRVDISQLAGHTGWYNAAGEALTHWTGIQDSRIRMVQGGPADITLKLVSTGSNVAGWAKFPRNGVPGDTVYLNQSFFPNGAIPTHGVYLRNVVHELGHAIGFRHTNWNQADCLNQWGQVVSCNGSAGSEGAVHIPGTPTSGGDPASVMNGLTAATAWNSGFSTYDRVAAARLYPLPKPTVSVSYPGYGSPVINWTPVAGASTYYVIYEVERWDANGYQGIDRISVAATTGTSATDWNRTYTAIPMCDFPGGVQEIYSYRVETFIDNKRSSGLVAAETGVC